MFDQALFVLCFRMNPAVLKVNFPMYGINLFLVALKYITHNQYAKDVELLSIHIPKDSLYERLVLRGLTLIIRSLFIAVKRMPTEVYSVSAS